MNEGNQNNLSDDLSEFSDYLNQFDDTINFDSETCPICGVNLSDSITVNSSPFIKILTIEEKDELEIFVSRLNNEQIKFKVVERLNEKVFSEISYVYDVFITIKDCEKYHKLIEHN